MACMEDKALIQPAGEVVNVAAYKFVPLAALPERRERLRAVCLQHGLKGTILLSTEGINLFVAGARPSVDALLSTLQADEQLGPLEVRESLSDHQPFNRMLVKIKKEIIVFGVDGIDPTRASSRKISPSKLKQWLDEDRPVTLLDVRNDYEVSLGTFEGAIPIGIDHFRSFPAAADQLPPELKDETMVLFCTGGIRCEKAGLYLGRAGFRDVYQLDGGILKYLQECGQQHFQGECFVFDRRVALDGQLAETDTALCFVCQSTLTAEEQVSPEYVVGESCPYCHQVRSVAG